MEEDVGIRKYVQWQELKKNSWANISFTNQIWIWDSILIIFYFLHSNKTQKTQIKEQSVIWFHPVLQCPKLGIIITFHTFYNVSVYLHLFECESVPLLAFPDSAGLTCSLLLLTSCVTLYRPFNLSILQLSWFPHLKNGNNDYFSIGLPWTINEKIHNSTSCSPQQSKCSIKCQLLLLLLVLLIHPYRMIESLQSEARCLYSIIISFVVLGYLATPCFLLLT